MLFLLGAAVSVGMLFLLGAAVSVGMLFLLGAAVSVGVLLLSGVLFLYGAARVLRRVPPGAAVPAHGKHRPRTAAGHTPSGSGHAVAAVGSWNRARPPSRGVWCGSMWGGGM
ncbi:hypothetical protein, partial [Agromyces sp. Soil535]|uniref:hypothetical protein n=1 Tax=Agromyces sp. Soil535 TaxID=1736390 RepID=UPI001F3DE46B